jgi:carbonic anhydrase/acetyltransferase-like protein (isoleucine patch superfamily)
VELGAVIVVGSNSNPSTSMNAGERSVFPEASATVRALYSPRRPILGNDAVQLWMDRVRTLKVAGLWLAPDDSGSRSFPSRLADLIRQGVEKLLVIKLKSYAEMDLSDLLRFHCEKRNPVTDAQDARGSLGVRLLNRSAVDSIAANVQPSCSPIAHSATHYRFRGYTKSLLSSQERQDLVRDALSGNCALRPAARQVQDQVWVGEGAMIDESVRMIGPVFVGSGTMVNAGATIGPFASIESNCIVDCGTSVARSTVLPHTFLAPGLLVQNSVVDGDYLESLESGTVISLAAARLARRIRPATAKRTLLRATPPANSFVGAGSEAGWKFPATNCVDGPLAWVRVEL